VPKVCVFGGGAIGGYIAGHLARAGKCDVSVVARGANLHAIRASGLRVVTPDGSFATAVRATSDAAELGVQDYVFLTLKAHQVDAALQDVSHLVGERTAIIPPTTGIPYYFFHGAGSVLRDKQMPLVDPGGRQWAALPPSQALGCVYWIGAHSPEPGVVVQDGAKAGCPIGELDGSHTGRVKQLAALLTESAIPSKVNDDIRGAIWMKFVNSLCWNPIAVLTMARIGAIADSSAVAVLHTMMSEADELARRLEVPVRQPPEKRIALTASAAHHKMSMLQDLESGRSLELDVLDKSLEALKDLAGIATPTLDAVIALTKLRAATLPGPGNDGTNRK
jgi:2-dehydropantoate 2-reductase